MDSKQILIADDHRSTRQAMKLYLETIFSEVEIWEARNGYEALDLVTGKLPDLILMDFDMPNLDGRQATQQIKAGWPQVKIIVLIMTENQRQAALGAGANTCLFKGGQPEKLREAMLVLLPDIHPAQAAENSGVTDDSVEDDDKAERLGTTPEKSG